MKKELSIILLSCFCLLLFIHCRKGLDKTAVPENKLSYQYNGQTYTGNGGPILDNDYRFRGLELRNTSWIGGAILFFYNLPANCAFLFPVNSAFNINPGCQLELFNQFDSSKLYFYRSGIINYSYSNCRHKKSYDPVAGLRIEYDECSVRGTFSLTLGNNNNETIVLTNGSFVFHPVRK